MAGNSIKRIVDIPALGTFLTIYCAGPSTYARIVESTLTAEGAPNVIQGWNYKLKNDGTASGFTTLFEAVPTADGDQARLELGDPQGTSHFRSSLGSGPQDALGAGAGSTPGTILLLVQSMGAATSLEITEQF